LIPAIHKDQHEPQPRHPSNGRGAPLSLLTSFEHVAQCLGASCVFADVQDRSGVMHSSIKPAFVVRIVGSAVTVQLDAGDLQDRLGEVCKTVVVAGIDGYIGEQTKILRG
jgi:hypothetical protein